MFQLGSVVSDIVKNITWLSPIQFRIVNVYQRGVRFTLGKNPTLLNPGMHFFVQWVQTLTIHDVVPTVSETHYQTIKTIDDKELTLSLGFMYHITDLVKYVTEVDDFQISLENIAQTFIANTVSKYTYRQFMDSRDMIVAELKKELGMILSEWGVEISNMGFINVSSARSFRLLYDAGSTISGIDELMETKLRRDMHIE